MTIPVNADTTTPGATGPATSAAPTPLVTPVVNIAPPAANVDAFVKKGL